MMPGEVRSLFPITASRAYLFAGGLAPAATSVRAALDAWSEAWALDPARLYAEYRGEREALRRAFASVIGADADEVALVDGTSRGSNLAVQMIDAPPGGNVVVDEFTYPSALYPGVSRPRRTSRCEGSRPEPASLGSTIWPPRSTIGPSR